MKLFGVIWQVGWDVSYYVVRAKDIVEAEYKMSIIENGGKPFTEIQKLYLEIKEIDDFSVPYLVGNSHEG
jgi:hypothetical protein